jgi:hypothetical protein
MNNRAQALLKISALIMLLMIALSACTTETIEVTRIKIMERRVIEKVLVTVEVTRIQRVVETPRPTSTQEGLVPSNATETPQLSPNPATATATPALPRPTALATATPVSSGRQVAEGLLTALQDTEQTLLTLVQALNSDPLPADQIIGLYNTLQSAPTFTIPQGETELLSVYIRYREQIDYVPAQASDLYAHLAEIQAGEANQTEVNPTHLALAREAASSGTSTVQGLIRELETYLAAQP